MSSIGSIGSSSFATQSMGAYRSSDAASMADKLFSKLDSTSKGYIEQSDLESALAGISSTASSEELFARFDSDSNGKVTQQEFSDSLTALAEQLDQQSMNMRLRGGSSEGGAGMQGMPPPPPPPPSGTDETGLSLDELTSQLSEIGSTDDPRAALTTKVVENFDAADANGDGKVSFDEAISYDQASSEASTSARVERNDPDALAMLQIARLMQAYGLDNDGNSLPGSLLSVTS
ncbi:MAG: EF-hand domain-containing protein [Rhodocyclaceae bacterium]